MPAPAYHVILSHCILLHLRISAFLRLSARLLSAQIGYALAPAITLPPHRKKHRIKREQGEVGMSGRQASAGDIETSSGVTS